MSGLWDAFGAPWFLLLLGLVPLIGWRWWTRSRHATIRFSSIAVLRRQGVGLRTRLRVLVPVLRSATVVLLVLCLARPQKDDEQARVFSEGIAVQLLVDRSGSMQARDFRIDGEPVDRLAAVKRVVHDFVVGDKDELKGRGDDLIGLIVFAGFADGRCPLTLDHGHLMETLNRTEIVDLRREGREEDGTAMGEAIALGVESLRDLDRRRNVMEARKIKSKIMVLLTDGMNNRGDISPDQAAEMAAALGMKIYTIGAGTKGTAPMPAVDPFGRTVLMPVQVDIDEDTLRKVAQTTGGQYFRATDTESLKQIYAQIDKLERTQVEEKRFRQRRELATASWSLGPVPLPSPLLAAFVLLGLEVLLANTVFRKVP